MAYRSLLDDEITLAKTLFKDSIKYSKVRVHDEEYVFFQPSNSGMTPNGEIYASGTAYSADYSKEGTYTRAFFIHEMVHVWQYQTGVLNPIFAAIGETIYHLGNYSKAYKYTLDASKDLVAYEIEQQASIVEHYYLIKVSPGALTTPKATYEKVLARFLRDPSYHKNRIQVYAP